MLVAVPRHAHQGSSPTPCGVISQPLKWNGSLNDRNTSSLPGEMQVENAQNRKLLAPALATRYDGGSVEQFPVARLGDLSRKRRTDGRRVRRQH